MICHFLCYQPYHLLHLTICAPSTHALALLWVALCSQVLNRVNVVASWFFIFVFFLQKSQSSCGPRILLNQIAHSLVRLLQVTPPCSLLFVSYSSAASLSFYFYSLILFRRSCALRAGYWDFGWSSRSCRVVFLIFCEFGHKRLLSFLDLPSFWGGVELSQLAAITGDGRLKMYQLHQE